MSWKATAVFDSDSAALLSSAPALLGLDPRNLPSALTRLYAGLASSRLSAGGDGAESTQVVDGWSIERVADSYELLATVSEEPAVRRPSAFVAASARQILARREAAGSEQTVRTVDRDYLDPAISSTILFLIAEQYADANEATLAIRNHEGEQPYECTILAEHIADLACGRLIQVIERAGRWRRRTLPAGIDNQAFYALVETICCGIELLASEILALPQPVAIADRYRSASAAFDRVIAISNPTKLGETEITLGMGFSYPGPHHLALLLTAAASTLVEARLMSVPPPTGANVGVWDAWLRSRASQAPYLWTNHRTAIGKRFYETGCSAVVILPTGAGKTTVSSLKIAGVLARQKKVIFLAPTHALVDQLTDDLQAMFPRDVMGAVVSSDFDMLLLLDTEVQDIEVMTPERCLAMLSFAPEAFESVGLLVFDECHLLSSTAGKIRRALDAMLCVLAFQSVAPDADMLFLSAMLENGKDLSDWVEALTGRKSLDIILPWKPSRQARGVVVYQQDEVVAARSAALVIQNNENERIGEVAKGLRTSAGRALEVQPYALWGLQHNWLVDGLAWVVTRRISDRPVTLAGSLSGQWIRVTPNANKVAAHIAATSARNGMKTIVFVNTKQDAVTVAFDIAAEVSREVTPSEAETRKWEALAVELGDLKHSPVPGPSSAVPHNGAMLKLERDICESLFRRSDGASTIVATPTLAQGLNLPAQLAILAGDKRADANGREDLKAHELLNAAARAGRAGHLANGLVLLVPDPIVSFGKADTVEVDAQAKLTSILPEDDHCVLLSDPLEMVLDRLNAGQQDDQDVRYMANRFSVIDETSTLGGRVFDLHKSMGAFMAAQRGTEAIFADKVDRFQKLVSDTTTPGLDVSAALLATQSGLSADLINKLRETLRAQLASLPNDIAGWVSWTVEWLANDDAARDGLLGDASNTVKSSVGGAKKVPLNSGHVTQMLPGLLAWIEGKPLRDIEIALGGEPDHKKSSKKRLCPRARELVVGIVPRSFTFAIGLIAHVLEGLVDPFDDEVTVDMDLVATLATAVRRGFDDPRLVEFSASNPSILSRVQLHMEWKSQRDHLKDFLGS